MAVSKQHLVDAVAATGLSKKQSAEVVSTVLDTIVEAVSKGEKVTVVGFGSFEQRKRAARKGRNPKTGEEIKIAASTTVGFKAGKAFKDAVK